MAEHVDDERTSSMYSIGDPDPLPEEATSAQRREWTKTVKDYAAEMLNAYKETYLQGEEMWIEFTTTFREHTIEALPSRLHLEWIEFLRSRGVYVRRDRGFPKVQALIECLRQDTFTPAIECHEGANRFRSTSHQQGCDAVVAEANQAEADGNNLQLHSIRNQNDDLHDQAIIGEDATASYQVVPGVESVAYNEQNQRSAGIHGLMRAYGNRDKFSGAFDEDLNSALELYETMSRMCRLSEKQKAEGFPIMLRADALNFYLTSTLPNDTFGVIVERFRQNYMTPEQKNRVLISWQSTRLSIEMRENPDKSELQVFRGMITKLSKLQRQLSKEYRNDLFLRDQIVISTDVPAAQQSMRERVPKSSADATNRISTFLSSEPRSAGAFAIRSNEDLLTMYSAENRFGGDAKKNFKGSKKSRSISKWLAGHKGCFVCKKNHRARQHHSHQEVSAAIEKIKKRYPAVLFTIEDIALLANEQANDDEDDVSITFSDSEDDTEAHVAEESIDVWRDEEQYLANVAFIHGRTFEKDSKQQIAAMISELRKGEREKFDGLYIDTCANRSSVMSLDQYRAYCSDFHVPMKICKEDRKIIRGIGGKSSAIGTAIIPVPFKGLRLVADVKFQIVTDKVPSLLCMKDMLQNGLDISIQNSVMTYKSFSHPLQMRNYFLIHKWEPCDVSHSLYSEQELRKLHRTFGHPSASALIKVLKAARPEQMTPEVRNNVMNIVKSCVTCSTYASKPKRFKITVGTEDLCFNHIVAVDIMYISKKPVLHVVDEATHFCSALFLNKVSSSHVWKALLKCWSRVYLGPPDHLRIDQGSQFVSQEFLESCEAEGISVLPAPIESPSTMSHVERYHGPLRAAYLKIRESLPRSESDADCLQMATKSVNDTIGPEGLCPTLLVFGSLPRPPRNATADTQIARAKAIEKAMAIVRKEQAKRRIAFGLKTAGGPVGKESSESLKNLPAGSSVLVYRKDSKKWEGPYTFINIDGETVTVQLPHGRKIFRSHVVKPVTNSILRHQVEEKSSEVKSDDNFDDNDLSLEDEQTQALFSEQDDNATYSFATIVMKPSNKHTFKESRKKELKGLMDRNIFSIVDRSSVPKGTRIFGTRWVDALKTVDGKTFEKSRIVARNFRDKGAASVATKAPTVTRLGLRLALSLRTMFPDYNSYLRDVSQAYTQSSQNLARPVFLQPVPEMNLPKHKVLKAIKPLYGIPEAGLYWFVTYSDHHKHKLGMQCTSFDPCVLYRRDNNNFTGLTVLQVDDSYGFGSKDFLDKEENTKHNFICKPRETLQEGECRDFNGFIIRSNSDGSHSLVQSKKLQAIGKPLDSNDFISERAKVQYIGNCTRPDVCAASQLLAMPVSKLTDKHFKTMNNLVKRCNSTNEVGLNYVPLDKESLRLMLFTDASFANAPNYKSQLGFVLLLADRFNKANIVHYGSSRCSRTTRSVMAAEIHGLIYGYDNAFVTKSMIEEILGVSIPIDGYVDSRTLFNVVAKFASTTEKRLQIDVQSLREAQDRQELRSLAWVPGTENIADGLTKGIVKDSHPLWQLMKTNTINISPQGWIERSHFDSELI